MELEEAIETTGNLIETLPGSLSDKERVALKLLIEAGKRIQAKRLDHWVLITPPLLGETTEEET